MPWKPFCRVPFTIAIGSVAALFAIATIGCGERAEIESYTVPKQRPSGPSLVEDSLLAQPASQPGRMLAAILFHNDQAWFFKMLGPPQSVEQVAQPTKEFFATLSLSEEGSPPVTWSAPHNWEEQPASGMREATLLAPTDDHLELAISKLPYNGDQDDSLLMNINRWRGQLGLGPLQREELYNELERQEITGGTAWIVDITGTMQATGMGQRPPFASGGLTGSGTMPPRSGRPAMPQFQSTLPEGWTEQPSRAMVLHVYQAGEAPTLADVAVSAFPNAAPQIANPLANIDRWRREVGLSPVTEADLDNLTEPVEIAGEQGLMAMIISEDRTKATLVAMVEKFKLVWFLKMTGNAESVEAHRDSFRSWLDSIEIHPAGNSPQEEDTN